jgi:hypothetical protein
MFTQRPDDHFPSLRTASDRTRKLTRRAVSVDVESNCILDRVALVRRVRRRHNPSLPLVTAPRTRRDRSATPGAYMNRPEQDCLVGHVVRLSGTRHGQCQLADTLRNMTHTDVAPVGRGGMSASRPALRRPALRRPAMSRVRKRVSGQGGSGVVSARTSPVRTSSSTGVPDPSRPAACQQPANVSANRHRHCQIADS